MKRIEAIRDEDVRYIKLPDSDEFKSRFIDSFKQLRERHTRDFTHVQQLIKSIALLNIWYRKQEDGSYLATVEDVEVAMKLWEQFSESQEMGVPPTVLRFYKDFVLPLHEEVRNTHPNMRVGFSSETLSNYHLHKTGTLLNSDTLRKQILPQLSVSGLIDLEKPEQGDKRSKWIYPKWKVKTK
jgi:hypothetical protein